MNYRFMRIILFFDLPSVTDLDKKEYRHFVKHIKQLGFYMLQESVYIKLAMNSFVGESIEKDVKSHLPKVGIVSILTVTEKQFQSMKTLIGKNPTTVIDSDERLVEL